MINEMLIILLVSFVASLAIVFVRERSRISSPPLESPSFTPRAASLGGGDDYLEREIDKLREQQVQLRIEIDRLKRPTGSPADG